MTESMDKNLAVTSGDVSTSVIDRIFHDTVITISAGFPEMLSINIWSPKNRLGFQTSFQEDDVKTTSLGMARWHGWGMAWWPAKELPTAGSGFAFEMSQFAVLIFSDFIFLILQNY